MQAEKKPWEMLFIGILYSSISVILGINIFGEDASLVIVFLTVLACFPIIYGAIKMEETKDLEFDDKKKLLKEHGKALSFFMFLFLGITLSFAVWYLFMSPNIASSVFSVQEKTIASINSPVSGQFTDTLSTFMDIFTNNFRVLAFCILFAFLYGVGALFVLVWNASVLGVAIGAFARNIITKAAVATGSVSASNYFGAMSLGVLRYSIHGIPEILAYFIAGLAGGIISIAIIKHDFRSKKFNHVILDSVDLIAISIAVLFVAAIIEVFFTPLFF